MKAVQITLPRPQAYSGSRTFSICITCPRRFFGLQFSQQTSVARTAAELVRKKTTGAR